MSAFPSIPDPASNPMAHGADDSGPSGSLTDYRARIDAVDDLLAGILEYRAQLTVEVQQLKADSSGSRAVSRDFQREAEIVARMARRAPALGAVRLQRIMHTVIEAGLDLAEERRP